MNWMQHLLSASAVPATALFTLVAVISGIQGEGAVEALGVLWKIFRTLHYIPKELADSILIELLKLSKMGAVLFLIYSYFAPLLFFWSWLCSEAWKNEVEVETRQPKSRQHSSSSEDEAKRTVALMSILSAVGRLPFAKVLLVLVLAFIVYFFVWLPASLFAILIGAIPAIEHEWAVVCASVIVSGLFIAWAYNLYPSIEKGSDHLF